MTFAQKRLSVVAIATTLVLALALGGLAGGFAPEQAFADEPAADQAAAKTYTIKYKGVSGAKNTNPTQVEKGKLKLKKPSKTGYTFKGWYQGKKKVTTVNVKKNLTLTAKWKAKTYKITYKNVKGTNKNAKKFTYGRDVKLKKLSKSGYTFKGWYSDKYLTKKVSKVGGKTAKNITVYAKWVQKPRNAAEKRGIKQAKTEVKKLNNQGATMMSNTLFSETGVWIDPTGKKIGCSAKLLKKASTYPTKTTNFIVKNCGINWYTQALMTANYCAGLADYGFEASDIREVTRDVLKEFGFTKGEINYALKNMKI